MNHTEGDIDVQWTFSSGGRRSTRLSEWGGVLVTAGDAGDDDDEDFFLQPVSKAEEKEPEPTPAVEEVAKVLVELPSSPKKMQAVSEEDEKEPELPRNPKKIQEISDDDATFSTYQDSFSSRDASLFCPKSPKQESAAPESPNLQASPKPQGALSPMERARLRLSKKNETKSARSRRKANAKMALNTMALKTLNLDDD